MKCPTGILAVLLLLEVLSLPGMSAEGCADTLLPVIESFEQQDYKEARQVLSELPGETRESARARYYLGRLDLIDGDRDGAVKALEKAIEADPGRSEYRHWLAVALMRRSAYRGFFGRMRDGMRAVNELRAAVELDSLNLQPRMTLFQIMARSYDRGGFSQEDLLEQARDITAVDSIMGSVALGTFFMIVEKDMVKAGAELERGHARAPDNRAAAISYADFLWECDRRDEAIRVLESFVERKPEDKSARFNLGTRLLLMGTDVSRAKTVLGQCLPLKSDTGMPSETMVRWCLGLAWHLLAEEDRAREEWARVEKLDGDFDRVVDQNPQMSELKALLDR